MSESLEALKRLRQETAPATYMKDFDKKKCCDVIEKDLKILEMLRPHLVNAGIISVDNEIFHLTLTLNGEEYNKLKEWLDNDN